MANSAGMVARHKYRHNAFTGRCWMCGAAESNRQHRSGSRCSVCFTYHKVYELDASRRCRDCQP